MRKDWSGRRPIRRAYGRKGENRGSHRRALRTSLSGSRASSATRRVAELDHVRGCMVIRPWGWGLWELMQGSSTTQSRRRAHRTRTSRCSSRSATWRRRRSTSRGFAKEMAVVTHHRLEKGPTEPPPRRRAARAADRPPHLGDDHRPLVREVDQLLPRPAPDDQPVGERRPLGASPARPPPYHRVPLAGGGTPRTHPRRRPSRRRGGCSRSIASSPNPCSRSRWLRGEAEGERFPGAESSPLTIEAMMQDGKALSPAPPLPGPELLAGDGHGVHRGGRRAQARLHHLVGALHPDDGSGRDDARRRQRAARPPGRARRREPGKIVPITGTTWTSSSVRQRRPQEGAGSSASWAGSLIRAEIDSRDRKPAEKRCGIRKGAPLVIELGGRDIEQAWSW